MLETLTLIALALNIDAGNPIPPTPEKVRATVEKGLAFLEKDGIAWSEKHKCASCHHVSLMLWNQQEARKRGLKIDEKAMEKATAFALKAAYKSQKGKPLSEFSGPSLEIIHLTMALAAEPQPTDAVAKKLEESKAYLLEKQDANGSWKVIRVDSEKFLPPIQDTDDVMTMLALLALSSGDASRGEQKTLKPNLDKAHAWLKDSAPGENHQSLALRIVVEKRFGKADQVQQFTKQLLSEQRADGGWGQIKERPSDAVATGQALYALAAAGIDEKHEAVERARAFLVQTQNKDGSWLVKTRVSKNKDTIVSYYGSGWAVLGLMQHLSK